MEREMEINLLFLKIRIRFPVLLKSAPVFPAPAPATLSRCASDWEFYKMASGGRRPFTLTKSYAALNFICDLEHGTDTEQEPEQPEDDYCLPHVPEVCNKLNIFLESLDIF